MAELRWKTLCAHYTLGEIVALDEDDNMAIVTRRLVEDYATLEGIISFNGAANLDRSDKENITTIVNVYNVLSVLFPKILMKYKKMKKKRSELAKSRLEDEELDFLFEKSKLFFEKSFNVFPDLKDINTKNIKNKIKKYRNSEGGSILYRPVGWNILAEIIAEYLDNDFTLEDAFKDLKDLPLDISDSPYKGIIWDTRKKTVLPKREHVLLVKEYLLLEYLDFEYSREDKDEILRKYHLLSGKK